MARAPSIAPEGQERLVDLLRHGEAAGGVCFRGSSDDPLTERGWQQLRAATAACDCERRWDAIVCSPARRCSDFALWLGTGLGVPVTRVDALRERHFGAWEGCPAADLPMHELAAFWSDPVGFTPPGAEPFEAFRHRVVGAWEASIAGGTARFPLILTHGGVIRVIVGEVLRMPAAALLLLEVPNACRTRIRLPNAEGFPSLVAHGPMPVGTE